MLFAFVNDNKVLKIEEYESYEEAPSSHTYQAVIDLTGLDPQPQVGWFFENGVLVSNLKPLKARQLRIAMAIIGVTSQMVEDAIALLDEPDRTFALINWQYADEIYRSEPLVQGLALSIGLTHEQLDEMWITGAKL